MTFADLGARQVEQRDPAALDAPIAEWPARAGAFTVDVLVGAGLIACLVLVGLSAPDGGWLWWTTLVPALVVLMAMAVNRWVLPTLFGWSLGRAAFGIKVVVARDGGPPGPWRLLGRDAAHLLDTLPLLLGWFWPLIDRRGRTFADVIAQTEVWVSEAGLPDPRRRAGIAVAVLTALATVAAALGFTLVFSQQRAVALTREQLQNTGPALVSDMLSYSAATVEKDFEHDRTLVTDGYRPDLMKEQDAVRKAGPADNEYWVTNKAVLEASRNGGAMLLLLQGQRGAVPNQRFITASLRVTFQRVAGDWKIAGLTVLAPPKLPDPPAAQEPEKPAPSGAPAPKKEPKPAPKPAPAPKPTGPGR